jgi:uncharacterized membrane-anchored protein YjiN (DUF445 family)
MDLSLGERIKSAQIDTEVDQQSELTRMKFWATALLGLAAFIFFLALAFEEQYPWVSFIRATAEAAMVGAIADWFAVTALFRHPLNLKIPHTAIIPTRKDSIGLTFGRFVKNNFLSAEVISGRLQSMDITRRLAGWVSRPENSYVIANYVAIGLAAVVQVMKDEDIQVLIQHNLSARVRAMKIAPLLGNLLSLVASGNRQQEILSGILKLSGRLLEENKETIMESISRETPWWLPQTIDNIIYQKIVNAFEKALQEVNADPDHPLRKNFDEVVTRFIDDLKNSPDVLAKEEALKEELLQDPAVQEFSSSLWADIKTMLVDHSVKPDSNIRRPIQQGVMHFGQTVLNNEALLEKIDHWVHEGAVYLVTEYGHEVESLIAYTISRWDAEETSRRIELHVGKDLQFIRINGTLVGGLVGLIIHTVYFLLK